MTSQPKNQGTIGKMMNSPVVKLICIGSIILIMLIPSEMIKSIIYEREELRTTAIAEVSDKWARSQQINGPILTIPYTQEYMSDDKMHLQHHYIHVLPERLEIVGVINPQHLKRAIYDIVVYGSALSLKGNFRLPEINKLKDIQEIIWHEAFVTFGISDLRGIKNQLLLKWNESELTVDPGSQIDTIIPSGVTILTPLGKGYQSESIDFGLDIQLNGSQNLSFVPVGGVTKVKLSSTWTSPSFNGNFLPDKREVTADGFIAEWHTLELNRNFPQSWIDNRVSNSLANSAFGVDLLLPIDDYQKSIRSAKYAIMTLALTFLVFFLVEVLNHKKIHPFQYILVGLALCLFYILLVSISEHSNFNMAYLVSSVTVISMITLYSLSIFAHRRLSVILSLILCGLFAFLFITLQLADYALIMGSAGLALIVSATMYFTRRINWYNLGEDLNSDQAI